MLPLVALAVAAAGLLALAMWTARPPDAPLPDRDGYFTRWAGLHHGHDPRGSAATRGWLTLAFHVARPFARWGVQPDVLTLWSVWVAFAVLVPAEAGGRWPVVAAWLVVASGLGDAVDGAVAALTGRASRWGHVLDSLADRVNDVIYLVALWIVGAPAALAVAAGVAFGLLEYLRARAGSAGMTGVGVITVGERPVRVVLCAVGLHVAGVAPEHGAVGAAAALAVLGVLSAAGFAQLGVVARRALGGEQ